MGTGTPDFIRKGVDYMEEWMRQPVTQLKRLVKSRAGRIAELQMEIKILEGIIEKKVSEGDLGGSVPRKPSPRPGPSENEGTTAKQENLSEESGKEEPSKEEPEQSKIKEKSSSHAFQEID
jgi:hypothetical protein